jgi:hypothetical protein
MRFGEKIYICKKKSNFGDLQEYERAKEYTLRRNYLSVQPTKGYFETSTYGKDITKYQTMICQPYSAWYGILSEGDLVYADGKSPTENEEFYGQDANYIVDGVFNQNEVIKIVLKRVN